MRWNFSAGSVCGSVRRETLFVKSPEDTVLRKLLWYRAGGERVLEAVARCRRGATHQWSGCSTLPYMDRWAVELKIDDLLRRAFAVSLGIPVSSTNGDSFAWSVRS